MNVGTIILYKLFNNRFKYSLCKFRYSSKTYQSDLNILRYFSLEIKHPETLDIELSYGK